MPSNFLMIITENHIFDNRDGTCSNLAFSRQVTLNIERVFGSLGAIQIRYNTYSDSALGGVDFSEIHNGAVNMEPRQTRSSIFVQVTEHTGPVGEHSVNVHTVPVAHHPKTLYWLV